MVAWHGQPVEHLEPFHPVCCRRRELQLQQGLQPGVAKSQINIEAWFSKLSFCSRPTSLPTTLGSTLGSVQLQAKQMLSNIEDGDDNCNDADDDMEMAMDDDNDGDKTMTEYKNNGIAGAALLLILANICLGCKYKWVKDLKAIGGELACILPYLNLLINCKCKYY